MEKIDVQDIIKKYGYLGFYKSESVLQAAVKEIVELVVDKCAAGHTGVEELSILKVKQLIDY